MLQRAKKDYLLVNVDFEKTYDRMSWDFLWYMIRRMWYDSLWMKWMKARIFFSQINAG